MPIQENVHIRSRTKNREIITTMARKKHSFNVLLSDQEATVLEKLANQHNCPRSFIIRQCLRWRAEMLDNGTPLCANGQRCFAPHLHMATRNQDPKPPAA